jgi:hypothetical protein
MSNSAASEALTDSLRWRYATKKFDSSEQLKGMITGFVAGKTPEQLAEWSSRQV